MFSAMFLMFEKPFTEADAKELKRRLNIEVQEDQNPSTKEDECRCTSMVASDVEESPKSFRE